MEATKSHNLLSASWRTKKAICKIQSSPVQRPRTRSFNLQDQKMEFPAQEERAKMCLSFTFLILFGPSRNWMMLAHSGECGSSLLGLLVHMLISSNNTVTDTHKYNIFSAIWASLTLVKLACESKHPSESS